MTSLSDGEGKELDRMSWKVGLERHLFGEMLRGSSVADGAVGACNGIASRVRDAEQEFIMANNVVAQKKVQSG